MTAVPKPRTEATSIPSSRVVELSSVGGEAVGEGALCGKRRVLRQPQTQPLCEPGATGARG
ncbi:hypothetical protein GCM10010358_38340 [Streptomyces minutiscleroticus]|uniref:Uncharacterized protein n=1 Tax=Streptomyces minutiscleroticus TaxID=68238 RepID=A0A918NM73_9ACTN|nr:hypothetical protein GCM10010358_38340 [Streptomyces minutiscleroticus]